MGHKVNKVSLPEDRVRAKCASFIMQRTSMRYCEPFVVDPLFLTKDGKALRTNCHTQFFYDSNREVKWSILCVDRIISEHSLSTPKHVAEYASDLVALRSEKQLGQTLSPAATRPNFGMNEQATPPPRGFAMKNIVEIPKGEHLNMPREVHKVASVDNRSPESYNRSPQAREPLLMRDRGNAGPNQASSPITRNVDTLTGPAALASVRKDQNRTENIKRMDQSTRKVLPSFANFVHESVTHPLARQSRDSGEPGEPVQPPKSERQRNGDKTEQGASGANISPEVESSERLDMEGRSVSDFNDFLSFMSAARGTAAGQY